MVKVILLVITAAGGNILFFPGQKIIIAEWFGYRSDSSELPGSSMFPRCNQLIQKYLGNCKALFLLQSNIYGEKTFKID